MDSHIELSCNTVYENSGIAIYNAYCILECFRNPFLDYAKIKITIKPRKQKFIEVSAWNF